MLTNFWNILLTKPTQLCEELSKIEPTNQEYTKIKDLLIKLDKTQNLLKDWSTDYYKREDVISMDDVKMAAYYYFNHNCSYGPGYLGWGSSVYLNESKWKSMIENIKNFKCENLSVFNKSFDVSISEHKGDFLYMDPPYYLERDSDNKMHKGMYPMKNIDVHHSGFNHELLRDLLLQHKGDFVLSYNNCETIREYYKDFDFYFPEWNYSMSNGEKRIGKNRMELNRGEVVKKSHEILIVKRKSRLDT
jgi:DNA adenine methylase